jgi:GTP-binding protein
MKARHASYLTSATSPASFPPPGAPEIAFAGRSNVGKSSLINTVTGQKRLARTSSTPGCTRQLNWFRVVGERGVELAFVDLPGYGYAKIAKSARAAFAPLIDAFIQKREVLRLVVVLIDARRGPEDEERDFIAWLAELGRPVQVVLTKADKLPKSQRLPAAATVRRDLGLARDPILFSATTGDGADTLWRVLLAAV